MTPNETSTRLLRNLRKEAVSADRLRRASAAPISPPVAVFSGIRTPMCRSPSRSISKGAISARASSGRDTAAERAASWGPRDETASRAGWPGASTRNAISLWVNRRIWDATASLSP